MRIFQHSHPQLTQALLYPYTHPVLAEVQTACLDLQNLFVKFAAAPQNAQLRDEFQIKAFKLTLAVEKSKVVVEYRNRSRLLRQLQEQQEKHRAEIFSTEVSEDEVGPLFSIQTMVRVVWPPDTQYVTAIFSPDSLTFQELAIALNKPFEHPILVGIQRAGRILIEILKKKELDPDINTMKAYNANMNIILDLTSEQTFKKLKFRFS